MTTLPNHRATVAVLVDYMNLFAGGFESEYRRAFQRVAKLHDLNLMFVYGRAIQHPDLGFAAHNRIYELLGSNCVSGVIALSSSITSFCGLSGAQQFFQNYSCLARCSVGLAVPGVPSIEVDNRLGMSALLDHLIQAHAFRRIAFIRGPVDNVEASVRYSVYREALNSNGIEFDERLVLQGDFARRAGAMAVEQLLARGDRLPEVIVAANDGMALGALSQLRQHGIQVPRDVAVTGFDDLMMARLGDPPLTTVAQPLERMVECSVGLVLDQLANGSVPEVVALPAEFVIRGSCGCGEYGHLSPLVLDSQPRVAAVSTPEIVAFAQQKRRELAGNEEYSDRDHSVRLLNALVRELEGEPDAVCRELKRLLFEADDNETFQILQSTVGRLRREFAAVSQRELDDLWFRACTLIALTNTRRQEQLRLDHDQAYYRWIDVGERFGAALDLATLAPALAEAVLTVGIDHAYISRYSDPELSELECIVAIRDARVYEPPARRFPATFLVPKDAIVASGRADFVAFPLAFNGRNLGVAVFELKPTAGGYPIIRDQISAVLESIALHQEILHQITLNERRVQEQERQATTQRIQALSVLAGGVAHDLNNVLGPLLALPDLMSSELDRLTLPVQLAETNLRSDLDAIKTAALRATQTIKDLLTLGRQGQTAKQPLDLNRTISRCLTEEIQRSVRRSVRIDLELCRDALFIQGSETHIERAITNLVRNAAEAVDCDGRVNVKTERCSVLEPIHGFETVEIGNYAVVSVSDTGHGIAAGDIGRLFEPFFSKKRLSDHSGSGLGLAIVHGVVKDHGGFIDVRSSLGCGTTFTLYLPHAEATVELSKEVSAPPRGQAKILVVDDEPLQLRTCRRVLTHLGYSVDTLSSGQQAMAAFEGVSESPGTKQSPYDLVILDMLLDREEDGLALFDRIRAIHPGQKGIIASGHAPSALVELASQRGVAWLAKPYTQNALARAVHTALNGSEPRRPVLP